MISKRAGVILLIVITAVVAAIGLLLPRIPQPQSYHMFADQRSFLGIPNFGDVISNLPFAVVGLCGLVSLLRSKQNPVPFIDRRERWPYLIVFGDSCLRHSGLPTITCAQVTHGSFGSLPMTIVFMSLVAAIIVERISPRIGLCLLPVLLAIGLAACCSGT